MSKALCLPLLAALLVLPALTSCNQKKTSAEASAEKQKAFQQQQMGKAAKYYQEIVENYPDSPFAAQARERLNAIGPVATPAPAAKKK